ncbi:MAG: multi-sensor hybrid histidine kinase [Devosia sp.]|nr:multi-sensor hybrid histidine kinase [Devosia sp.]
MQERDLVFDMSPDLVAVATFDGMLKSINPAWSRRLGRSNEFLAMHPFSDIIHPDDLAETGAVIAELIAGRPVHQFHVRLLTADGTPISFAWSAVPGVEPGTFYTAGRDITEEVEREAELAARTAERDRLWTLSEDMFARADLSGMMSAVNPGWTRVLGWSEQELLTRSYATFMHDEDMEPTLGALARMGETGQPTRFENRIATADGEWKWIGWTVVPELDGQHFIAVGRDLTDAKASVAELMAAQEALRQAQKMEAVGQLTGGIAHDFNNIIAGVSGSLELMRTRLAQGSISEVERYLTASSAAVRRAASLTQRLLAFSRRQTLDPKPANVNALTEGMLDLIHRSVGPEIEVETVGKAGLWPTFVDIGQLESSLLNLCINARDAMPNGGKITIETANRWMDDRSAKERGLAPGQYVSMCVSDTGSGMPKDVIERAFDPFFTTKPIGQGTGLGLSMVHGFAGQSGGTVRIYSEVGEGTMVCVYLPRHLGDDAQETVEELSTETPRPNGQPTVMLVDDEPLVRMVAAEHLEELGYTVLEAGDAHEALRVMDGTDTINLLITDVGLPLGMNGRQLAEIVKQKQPELPILFITGYAENAVFNHGHLDRGMHMMSKPFQMDAFARKVSDLLAAIKPS